ncbi:hypothetical protein LTR93_011604 [Exophiala xenobiotica]|nr:hypothetical protein LTR93_011604 [Exophiala xenobiotica]
MDVAGFAVVTGAGSGIGRACAHGFAREGAAGLALLDLNASSLEKVKDEVEEIDRKRTTGDTSAKILTFVVNVSQGGAKDFGRIDYLAHCAGVAFKHPGGAANATTADVRNP